MWRISRRRRDYRFSGAARGWEYAVDVRKPSGDMELRIDPGAVDRARSLARAIVEPIEQFIVLHSTVSVERAIVRLLGVDGVGPDDAPVPNLVVDALSPGERAGGVARHVGRAVAETGLTPAAVAARIVDGTLTFASLSDVPEAAAREALRPHVDAGLARIRGRRDERAAFLQRLPQAPPPLLYVIVASGNIYEDRAAAVAAAEAGAQIIAVIRSTGQSLLDFVPYGPTTEGFGGTYATQENFRIVREALDEVSERLGRYVMLTNYASGLCMPEIAAMAALERLDMLLNDAMYGILFRDINMKRTFIDQHFSRMLNGRAGIIINTGEDNYLTTADAVEQAPAVLASQFINEEFARRAGVPEDQMGLGDAYEIDPGLEDGFLFALAQAQLARQIFPRAPLKYMPPTKHMTGDIFKGHLIDAMFNLTSVMTGQTIHLCGMLTEAYPYAASRRPRLVARERALRDVDGAPSGRREISWKQDGIVERRAQTVLSGAELLLGRIAGIAGSHARDRGARVRGRLAVGGRRSRRRRCLRTGRLLESVRGGAHAPVAIPASAAS